jgi:hypothetical protein
MRLPARGFHQFFRCGAVWPLQQLQHERGLAALAGSGGLFGLFLDFGPFLSRGGLLGRLALGGRNVGATFGGTGLLGGFRLSLDAVAWVVSFSSVIVVISAPLAVITAVMT